MYSLRLLLHGDYRYSDGSSTVCSKRNLFIPPDRTFRGSFQDIRLLFIDLSPSAIEHAFGSPLPHGLGLAALDSREGANLRALAFASVKQAEKLTEQLRRPFLRNFQNVMACAVAALLREMRPDLRRPDPMIGRRKVADLREWAALDHDGPLTVGDLAARCGLGLRALQKNFLRHFDATPAEFLRGLRLDKARKLILSGAISVTHAALEAGFVHLGHFSENYEHEFGELPSITAARSIREQA